MDYLTIFLCRPSNTHPSVGDQRHGQRFKSLRPEDSAPGSGPPPTVGQRRNLRQRGGEAPHPNESRGAREDPQPTIQCNASCLRLSTTTFDGRYVTHIVFAINPNQLIS